MRIIGARAQYQAQGARAASWKTWAYTIAHHAAMDRLRASGGREMPLDLPDDEGDAMDWLQATLDLAHPSSEDTAFWRAANRSCWPVWRALPWPSAPPSCCTTRKGRRWKTSPSAWRCPSRLPAACATPCKLRGCAQAYLVVMEGRTLGTTERPAPSVPLPPLRDARLARTGACA